MPSTSDAPRWRVDAAEFGTLEDAWTAWMEAMQDGYFGARAARTASQSILIEGIAQGLAWLLIEVALRRRPPRRRSVTLGKPGSRNSPAAGTHEWMAAAAARSALSMGRDFVRRYLDAVDPTVAATAVVRAASAASRRVFAQEDNGTAARTMLAIELRERLESLTSPL